MRPAPGALAGAAGLLVAAALFFGGAATAAPLLWIGGGALVVASLGLAAALTGSLRAPGVGRIGAAWLALLAAFVVWNGLSIRWSIEPGRSWDYLNRGLVYLAFAVLGLLLAAVVPRAPRRVAEGLALALALLLAWSLLEKAVPSLYPDYGRIARLRGPVGYWNMLALLGDVAIVLALWLVADRRRRPWTRAAGLLLLYEALVGTLLTYSRTGLALAVLVAVAWLVFTPDRVEGLLGLLAVVPLGAAVGAFALTRRGIADDGQPHATRVHDGLLFAIVFLAGAVLLLGASRLLTRVELAAPGRRRLVRAAALVGAALAIGALGLGIAKAGSIWHQVASEQQVVNTPGRIRGLNSSNRWTWWKEAWRAFTHHPGGGTGAGTFGLTDLTSGHSPYVAAVEPHNTPLQFLSETGLVGFALAAGSLLAAVLALRRRLGRAESALALAAAAVVIHSLFDTDWEYVAVAAPFFLVVGVLVGSRRVTGTVGPRRRLPALAALLIGAACLYSLTLPSLANRQVNAADAALGRADWRGAAAHGRSAHSLNPLSVAALERWGIAEERLRHLRTAFGLYVQARDLEPRNPDTWAELGAFELHTLHDACRAYRALNHSYTLDAFQTPDVLSDLDHARQRVNHGACRGRATARE